MNDLKRLYRDIEKFRVEAERALTDSETHLIDENILELSKSLNKAIIEFLKLQRLS